MLKMEDIRGEVKKRIDEALGSISLFQIGKEVKIEGPVSGFKYPKKASELFSQGGKARAVREIADMEKAHEFKKMTGKAA